MVEEGIREAAPVALPDKKYFKIGETATLLGVKPHVLRYWETEFPQIRPYKSKTGQRLYRRSDVEALLKIQKLFYEERLSIAGVRQALRLNNWVSVHADESDIDEDETEEIQMSANVINVNVDSSPEVICADSISIDKIYEIPDSQPKPLSENNPELPSISHDRDLDPDISRLLSIPLLSAQKKLQEILRIIDG
jgi:DNA-binding transcriptional MerR regulator